MGSDQRLSILLMVCCLAVGQAQVFTEDFEGTFPGAWVTVGGPHLTVGGAGRAGSTAVSGLLPAGWIYNLTTSVGAGDRVTFWTFALADNATWLGVDAGPGGCRSFVFAPNTNEIRIEENLAYGFSTMAAQPITWVCCVWYEMELELQPGGVLVGRLRDDGGQLVGEVSHTFGSFTGGGLALRVGWGEHFGDDLEHHLSVQAPTCAITDPPAGAVLSGSVDITFSADDAQQDPLTATLEYSTDAGQTYQLMTPAASSALPNPVSGLAPPVAGLVFTWDTQADGVGSSSPAAVAARVRISDGGRESQCHVDVTVDSGSGCGDCNLDGVGPNIVDALTAAQIAASLISPSPQQQLLCDVNSSSTIDILDALMLAQVAAGLLPLPGCPAAPPPQSGVLYVLQTLPEELLILDQATGALQHTIPLADQHVCMASDPVRDRLYLARSGSWGITTVDTATGGVMGYLPVADLSSDHLAIAPDGSVLVGVTRTSGHIMVLELPTLATRHAIPVTGSPPSLSDLAIAPDSRTIWVIDIGSSSVVQADAVTGVVSSTIPLGAFPAGLDISSSGATLYVVLGFDNLMVRIDTATGQEILPRQPTGVYPFEVLGHSQGNAFVMNIGDHNVAEHDGVSGLWLRQWQVGLDPGRVREVPGGEVAVVSQQTNNVLLIDPVTGGTRTAGSFTSALDVTGR